MTITVQVDDETKSLLASNARRNGQSFDEYVAQVLIDTATEVVEDVETTNAITQLAEHGGSFDWLEEETDIYTIDDLKVRYK